MALKFKSVFTQLQTKIISGHWPEGYKIPTEMELCEEYGVSRVTIRRALDGLVKRGYLVRTRGRGSYVHFQRSLLGASSPAALRAEATMHYRVLERREVEATDVDIVDFGLSADQGDVMLWHLKILHMVDEVPAALSDYYFVSEYGSFIPTMEVDGKLSVHSLVAKHHGQRCYFKEGRLAAIIPSAQTHALLQIDGITAALWSRGYCTLEDGVVIGRCSKIYNGLIYEFAMDGKYDLHVL